MERIDKMAERLGISKLEMAKRYYLEHGCQLLAEEWPGATKKMPYRCHCGNVSESSWNKFSQGRRCGHCTKWGQKKKLTLEQVQAVFRQHGCEFLDDHYNGVHYRHNYRCPCGRKSKTALTCFNTSKNKACKNCCAKKRSGPNHHEWKPDRQLPTPL